MDHIAPELIVGETLRELVIMLAMDIKETGPHDQER